MNNNTQLQEMENAGEQIAKSNGKRGSKSASLEANLVNTTREDIGRILSENLKWYKMTPVKTDEECAERLEYFFTEILAHGELPTMEKMFLALGSTKQTVWRWEQGELGVVRSDLIKKAKALLGALDGQLVTEGKIPQIVYIFRAKNYHGMVDKQEYVLTPNNALGDEANKDDIEKRLTQGIVTEE